jgi:hypothetical protein
MSPLALWVDQFRGATKMVGIGLALVLAALAGGWLNGVFKAREIAALETALQTVQRDHAEQWRIAAEHAAADMQAAQARGDALTNELEAANRQADALRGELDEQITLATQGRACLDAAALRVLDRAPGIAARPVPAAPRRAAAAGGAGATADPPQPAGGAQLGAELEPDERSASDTDLARWALSAGARYDECARRLGALIDWHDNPTEADRVPAWN